MDASGNIVGKGDIAVQTEQVLVNLRAALAAGGAGPDHVVKWNLLVAEGKSLEAGSPPSAARGPKRRTRRRSPSPSWRGWRTRSTW